MTEPKLPAEPTPFIYLLNRMESAASDVNPHMSGYPRHRKAVLEHVAKVERELTSALALAAERELAVDDANLSRIAAEEERELLRKCAEAANARAEAMSRDARMWRTLREKRPVLLLTGFFGNGCVNRTIEHVEDAIDAMVKL